MPVDQTAIGVVFFSEDLCNTLGISSILQSDLDTFKPSYCDFGLAEGSCA